VTKRQSLLHDAWLGAIGHKRPGVKQGLPLEKAQAEAKQLAAKIERAVEKSRQPTSSHRLSTGGTIFQVHYPATARPGALQLSVDYYLWIPAKAERLRGLIVHQHGCGPGASLGGRTAADDLHWQSLARKWFLQPHCVQCDVSFRLGIATNGPLEPSMIFRSRTTKLSSIVIEQNA